MKDYSLVDRLAAPSVPQFLCYGTKDQIKGHDDYAAKLAALGIPHKTVRIEGAGHGFALEQKKYAYWGDEFAKWVVDVV